MESGSGHKSDEERYDTILGFSKKEEKKRNEEIEKQLKAEKKVLQKQIKLLLLGAGESGKSTIAKQMKILHLQGFNATERKEFVRIIRGNILDSMKILVTENKNLKIGIDSANEAIASKVQDATELTQEVAQHIAKLWQDTGIKKTFDRASEFQFYDSAEYFLKSVSKYADEKYVPDEQDILRSRVRTTGAYETIFTIEGITFRLVDVGGQRSERRKWLSCFTDVTAVIFCVALSEYDQKLAEDLETNRMHESLELFDAIINNKWLRDTSMILFLNKRDLFAEKVKKVDLRVCFDDYKDGKTYEKALDFIKDKFLSRNKQPKRRVYVHVTCATDTDSVAKVWAVVQDILLKEALGQIGVM